jgi:heterodisulfide reductase subunit A
MSEKIGVYVCHCGTNISHTVDVEDVTGFASGLLDVAVARDYKYMCSDPGQDLIKKDIVEQGLTRVVVASCSPLMHEPTFRYAVQSAGVNPYLMQMANIREQCSWVTPDRKAGTEKAKRLVSAAVRRVVLQKPLEPKEAPVNPNTLVIGAGITGIEAALKIADSGKKVYLVEKSSTIGGHMAQFDKTFPTLDCAACILTPKMVQVGRHPNVELMTYAEVSEVSGYVGNFKVKVKKKPRYINAEKCTGCGDCEKVCGVEVDSEFEENMSKRKAAYRAFPQAVPGAYVIDKHGNPPCRNACPAGVNAQGYIELISQKKYKEAWDLIRRTMPLPAVCGRVCYHWCEKECERARVDEPIAINALKRFASDFVYRNTLAKGELLPLKYEEKVAVVGSGPSGLACAFKLAKKGYPVTVFETMPKAGGMLRYGIPEFRLSEGILDSELTTIGECGIKIETGKAFGKDLTHEGLEKEGYKAFYLAVGAWKGLELDMEGESLENVYTAIDFLKRVKCGEKIETGNKVLVVGGGNSAMDAARTAVRLGAKEVSIVYRRSREEMPAHPIEIEGAEQEGVKLLFLTAPNRIKGKEKVEALECIRMDLGPPDASGRRRPIPQAGTEFDIPADTVIIAAGQAPIAANMIKDLRISAGGTIVVDPETFQTNIRNVFAGGDCITGPASVVEAFNCGNEAAVSIDKFLRGLDMKTGREVRMRRVERVDIEGVTPAARRKMPEIPVSERKSSFSEVERGLSEVDAVAEAERCLSCAVCSECLECEKACGAGAVDHGQQPEEVEIDVGAIVVATGFDLFDCSKVPQFGYGRLPNVLNSLEFERLSHASGPTGGKILLRNGKEPKSLAIVHCVGSRDEHHNKYCSRVCCMYGMKMAHLVREKTGARVYEFYIDIRAFGKGYEEFYHRMLEEDVEFIRGKVAEVTDAALSPEEEGKLVVRCEDTLLGFTRRIPVDMVVLCAALEPRTDATELRQLLGCSRSKDGFLLEKHPKLAPVSTATDGVFIAGACQGPKDIPDSVAQGAGAAAEALSLIDRGKVEIEPITSVIDSELCSGCRICNELCPYSAIEFKEDDKISSVIDALCKGCGTCAAACPSGAISSQHFTDDVIFSEIEGVLI